MATTLQEASFTFQLVFLFFHFHIHQNYHFCYYQTSLFVIDHIFYITDRTLRSSITAVVQFLKL